MNIIENVNRLEDYLINESEISLIDIQKISTYLTNIREEAINYTRCCEALPCSYAEGYNDAIAKIKEEAKYIESNNVLQRELLESYTK